MPRENETNNVVLNALTKFVSYFATDMLTFHFFFIKKILGLLRHFFQFFLFSWQNQVGSKNELTSNLEALKSQVESLTAEREKLRYEVSNQWQEISRLKLQVKFNPQNSKLRISKIL